MMYSPTNPLKSVFQKKNVALFTTVCSVLLLGVTIIASFSIFNTSEAQANDDNVIIVRAKYNGGSDERRFYICEDRWDDTRFQNKRTNSVRKLEMVVTAQYKDNQKTFERRSKGRYGPYFNGPLTRPEKIEIYNSERDIFRGNSSLQGKVGAGRFYARKFGAECNNEPSVDLSSLQYSGAVYNFNFGTKSTIDGHVQDNGKDWSENKNEKFGWTRNHSEHIAESSDGTQTPAHNGLKGYAKFLDGNIGRRWLLRDIPNGYYEVEAIVGTPHYDENARHHVTANDDTVVFCDPVQGQQQWCEGRTRINVVDNKIAIGRGDLGNNVAINLVRIRALQNQ